MEDELVSIHDQGVACVVSALKPYDHIGVFGEDIYYLALALVAPLGTDNHY